MTKGEKLVEAARQKFAKRPYHYPEGRLYDMIEYISKLSDDEFDAIMREES